jgi:hypothetical protein
MVSNLNGIGLFDGRQSVTSGMRVCHRCFRFTDTTAAAVTGKAVVLIVASTNISYKCSFSELVKPKR